LPITGYENGIAESIILLLQYAEKITRKKSRLFKILNKNVSEDFKTLK
jgi:hypothetical protein